MKWWKKFKAFWHSFIHGGAGGGSEFLCDTCKYDYGNACTRRERPNARVCPDYKRN